MAWLLEGEAATVRQAAETASSGDGVAPVIFWHEVASALRNIALRGGMSLAQRGGAVAEVQKLNIAIDAAAPPIADVLRVSDAYQLTVYDAAYLELAIRRNAALATRDAALIQAGRKAGIAVLS